MNRLPRIFLVPIPVLCAFAARDLGAQNINTGRFIDIDATNTAAVPPVSASCRSGRTSSTGSPVLERSVSALDRKLDGLDQRSPRRRLRQPGKRIDRPAAIEPRARHGVGLAA